MNIEGIEIPTRSSFRPPRWLWIVCILAVVAGIGGFAAAFLVRPREAWLWLLVDFVIFVGIADGLLLWAAAFRVAQTRWALSVNRLGHSAIFFMPLLYTILVILLAGVRHYAPWAIVPVPGKEAWLNVPFMVLREAFAIGLLWILYAVMVRRTLKADAKAKRNEEIDARDHFRLNAVSTVSVIWYTLAETLIAYDFIMSLSPLWVSEVFAPYFWLTNMYLSMAVLVLMAASLRKAVGAERFLGPERFHDMGNLLLGFSLFAMGLFFAQYLTIWYENLPEETHFLILRYYRSPWQWPAWTAFIIGYAIPFLLLQSRRLKRSPGLSAIPAILILLGVMLERYVLIVPSVAPVRMFLYFPGLLGLFGFAGAFLLAVCAFLMRYSPVSAADAALRKSDMKLEIGS